MVRPDGLLPSWKSSALEIASNPKAISYWESELGLDPSFSTISEQETCPLISYYDLPIDTRSPQCQGGHEWLVAEFVLITCIFDIDRCYNGIAEDLTQLKRRVTKVIKFPLDEDSPWEIEKLDDTEIKILVRESRFFPFHFMFLNKH